MRKVYFVLLLSAVIFMANNSFSQTVLWSDDFTDGNYTSNWEWTLLTGAAAVVSNNNNNELQLTGLTPDWYCNIQSRGDTNNTFTPDNYTVTYTTRMSGPAAMGSALAFKIDDANYYYVLLYSGYIYIVRTIDYIANVPAALVQKDQNLKVKIQSVGDTVRVRVWTGLFEPSTWDLQYDSCSTSGTLYPDLLAACWWMDGSSKVFFDNFMVYSNSPTDIKEEGKLPVNYSLNQNYPNPFNPSTTIRYSVPDRQFVSLKIYDVLGNETAVLVNDERPAGVYNASWNAASVPSGVYFYKLRSGSFTETKKMLLLK